MAKTGSTYIYRIIHRNNLSSILKSGELVAPNYASGTNYISIGETELIGYRSNKIVPLKPFGNLKDYITFYFGPRSPMLYAIANGYDVKRIDQEEIIYLVSSIEDLELFERKYVFTDGHAFAAITQFFNNKNDLGQLDWKTIYSVRWNNTMEDPDRKRRKQAECLVYKSVPFSAIITVCVYNQSALDYIAHVFEEYDSTIPVKIKPDFYY